MALHNYHANYNSFPPAYIADENGRPVHSWRVLILPYVGETPLYNKYRFDEPWDGPNNRKLWERRLKVFQCPSDLAKDGPRQFTSYVAVVGPTTAFPGSKAVNFSDIKDGPSSTIAIVEMANSGIHWLEPRDLDLEQMAPKLNSKTRRGISSRHHDGVNVLFVDRTTATVRFLSETETTPALLRQLLEINDGQPADEF